MQQRTLFYSETSSSSSANAASMPSYRTLSLSPLISHFLSADHCKVCVLSPTFDLTCPVKRQERDDHSSAKLPQSQPTSQPTSRTEGTGAADFIPLANDKLADTIHGNDQDQTMSEVSLSFIK